MPRLRPLTAFRLSPLGVVGVVVAGVTTASFRMVGPLYGQEVGLDASQIGYFLALFVLGGAGFNCDVDLCHRREFDHGRVRHAISVECFPVCSVVWCGYLSYLFGFQRACQ